MRMLSTGSSSEGSEPVYFRPKPMGSGDALGQPVKIWSNVFPMSFENDGRQVHQYEVEVMLSREEFKEGTLPEKIFYVNRAPLEEAHATQGKEVCRKLLEHIIRHETDVLLWSQIFYDYHRDLCATERIDNGQAIMCVVELAELEDQDPIFLSFKHAKVELLYKGALESTDNFVGTWNGSFEASEQDKTLSKFVEIVASKPCLNQIVTRRRISSNSNGFLLRSCTMLYSTRARFVRVCNDLSRFPQALLLAGELVRELKKIDDKHVLVEVELEESKAFYNLGNVGHAQTSLSSARTTANSVYVSPRTQAALDLQAGILHAADKKDFRTAFSYFYEAFEGYNSIDEKKTALRALKYMLLCKVMLDLPDEAETLLSGKSAQKYTGSEIDAMRAIATASKKRSLTEFNNAFGNYRDELQMDPVVGKHFHSLAERMLEKELCRLIEPYSFVQIEHIANLVGIDKHTVEKKLAQMILDKKFIGSLHQGEGMLIVYDFGLPNTTYDTSVETIHALSEVVDGLYQRANTLE